MQKYLVEHCAPTLAGLKTASLFNLSFSTREELDQKVLMANQMLNDKGLYCEVLGLRQTSALIYVYRQQQLEMDLSRLESQQVLSEVGYCSVAIRPCLELLKERLCYQETFPHEIGLFLGYPVEDVVGFIGHQGKNSKHTGYWKVYGDVVESIKLFTKFKKCKHIYKQRFGSGVSIQQLIVAD